MFFTARSENQTIADCFGFCYVVWLYFLGLLTMYYCVVRPWVGTENLLELTLFFYCGKSHLQNENNGNRAQYIPWFFYYSLTLFWDNSYSVSMSLQESVRILAYYDNYNTNPRKILFFGNYLKYCFFFEKKGTIHMSKILWKRNQVKSGLNTDRSWAFQLTLSLPDFPNISRHWSPSDRLWKGPSMSKNDSKRKENVVKGSRGLLTAQNSLKVLRIESIVPRFS